MHKGKVVEFEVQMHLVYFAQQRPPLNIISKRVDFLDDKWDKSKFNMCCNEFLIVVYQINVKFSSVYSSI